MFQERTETEEEAYERGSADGWKAGKRARGGPRREQPDKDLNAYWTGWWDGYGAGYSAVN